MIETKIVAWTIGGSFGVATLIFATKITLAIGTAINLRVSALRAWLEGDSGSILKNISGGLWEIIKGVVPFGS